LAGVDDDAVLTVRPLQNSGQKALGRDEVAPFSEPELNRVTMTVNGSVEIHPSPADFVVGFVDVRIASR